MDEKAKPVSSWSVNEVAQWLSGSPFAPFVEKFKYTNGMSLLNLDVPLLSSMGIPNEAAAPLYALIQSLKVPTPSAGTSSSPQLNLIQNGKYFPPKLPSPRDNFYEREDCINKVINYISKVKQMHPSVYMDGKFALLGTSGMKGIGKTELLKQLCARAKELGVDQTFYFNFNGGAETAAIFNENIKESQSCRRVFAHLLLCLCGVDMKIAQQLKFREAMNEFRRILQLDDNQTLLICVDEVGELGNDIGKTLLSELMQHMDAKKGKLIFVFTHILESFLLDQTTGSGRIVRTIPLFSLSIDIWKTNKQLSEGATNNPPLHQLLLSCCGHPRAIFDGFPVACDNNPTLLTDSNELAIADARSEIIECCKFRDVDDNTIYKYLKKWFSGSLEPEDQTYLKNAGLLLSIKGKDKKSTNLFFPLLVQDWAKRNSSEIELAYHLQQAYAADAVLGLDSEKKMEAIMYHYEAILHICSNDSPFSIQAFYKTKFCGLELSLKVVIPSILGRGEHIVRMVDDFSETKKIIQLLTLGYILVSEKHSEEGVEYLVPYRDSEDNKLVVGVVQCKYVKAKTNWKAIQSKIKNATEGLMNEGIHTFPVVFSTVDQSCLQSKTYEGGIYFTEKDTFEFTNKLGILRLHTQKLGQVLKEQYPILAQASFLELPITTTTTAGTTTAGTTTEGTTTAGTTTASTVTASTTTEGTTTAGTVTAGTTTAGTTTKRKEREFLIDEKDDLKRRK